MSNIKPLDLLLKIITVWIPVLLIMAFLLFPFYWTFITSIKTPGELYGAAPGYLPQNPSFESYKKIFMETGFLEPMRNSLIVATSTTLLSLFVSTLAAYAFSRYRFPGRRPLMAVFLANHMFPPVLLLVPLYVIMKRIGILHTPLALILAYSSFTIPFSIWLIFGYLKSVPASLEEAAMIDGANRAQAFVSIVFPALRPCLTATGVFLFITSWNEYIFAAMFTDPDSRTIPVALGMLVDQPGLQWELISAYGIITVIPVFLMFFLVQGRLIERFTTGTIKG